MHSLRPDQGTLATALFDPDEEAASRLAGALAQAGFRVERRADADEFIAAVRADDCRTVVVAADLANPACRRFLHRLRVAVPHSWLVISNATVDAAALRAARSHGIDVVLAMPIDVADLSQRLHALQARSRPSF
jgi:DNA-binding response OmpR family regulator